jgi:hypothetical protein
MYVTVVKEPGEEAEVINIAQTKTASVIEDAEKLIGTRFCRNSLGVDVIETFYMRQGLHLTANCIIKTDSESLAREAALALFKE